MSRAYVRIFSTIAVALVAVQRLNSTSSSDNAISGTTKTFIQNENGQVIKAKQLKTNRRTRLFFVKNDNAPLIHVMINFKNSGPAHLERIKAGIPYLYEHIFCCGCGKYSKSQILKALKDISCDMTCNVTQDSLSFSVTIPKIVMQEALFLIYCIINEPRFEENAVKNIQLSLPGPGRSMENLMHFAIHTIIPSLIFRSHTYENGIYGRDEDFINLTIDDMRKYRNKYLTAANAEVCICGNLTENEAIQLVNQIFASTNKNVEKTNDIVADVVPKIKPDVKHYYVNGTLSTVIFVQKGVLKKSSKRYAAMLLYHIIGAPGVFKSRILSTLRTQLGLIYRGNVCSRSLVHADLYLGMLQTDNSNVERVMNAVKNILKQIKTGSITKSDLDFAKRNMKGKILINMRTTASICNFFYDAMIHNLGENALEDFIKGINSVTLDDIHMVARELLDEENMLFVVIGGKCKKKKNS
ncbi:MAG: insulinase family protein [Holosporaceae bacterium]|jgi:zinc protease|nr:insulinase family protein [Holosporaceae bacterium]